MLRSAFRFGVRILTSRWHLSPRARVGVAVGAAAGSTYIFLNWTEPAPISGRSRLLAKNPETVTRDGTWLWDHFQLHHEFLGMEDPRVDAVVRVTSRLLEANASYLMDPSVSRVWEVAVLDTEDPPNAFCLPNGVVCVHSTMLDEVIDSGDPHQTRDDYDERLAAVIAHEMAHVVCRHAEEKIGWEPLLMFAPVVMSAVSSLPLMFTMPLVWVSLSLPLRRLMELEADVVGTRLMANACYNPEMMIPALERLHDWMLWEAVRQRRLLSQQLDAFTDGQDEDDEDEDTRIVTIVPAAGPWEDQPPLRLRIPESMANERKRELRQQRRREQMDETSKPPRVPPALRVVEGDEPSATAATGDGRGLNGHQGNLGRSYSEFQRRQQRAAALAESGSGLPDGAEVHAGDNLSLGDGLDEDYDEATHQLAEMQRKLQQELQGLQVELQQQLRLHRQRRHSLTEPEHFSADVGGGNGANADANNHTVVKAELRKVSEDRQLLAEILQAAVNGQLEDALRLMARLESSSAAAAPSPPHSQLQAEHPPRMIAITDDRDSEVGNSAANDADRPQKPAHHRHPVVHIEERPAIAAANDHEDGHGEEEHTGDVGFFHDVDDEELFRQMQEREESWAFFLELLSTHPVMKSRRAFLLANMETAIEVYRKKCFPQAPAHLRREAVAIPVSLGADRGPAKPESELDSRM